MEVLNTIGPITAFLPCRKGSERVPRKNIRPFAGHDCGLLQIKLGQLLDCEAIDRVVVSSDDPEVLGYADGLGHDRIDLHERRADLASSQTSTDALVGHAADLITEGHILWTHVTSPFFGATHYRRAIDTYWAGLNRGYDSLMTTTPIRGFLWNESGPLNYDRTIEKWPRTQTLPVIHEVNSAVFLAPVDIYRSANDRIGDSPILFDTDGISVLDIDWEEDFHYAEALLKAGVAKI